MHIKFGTFWKSNASRSSKIAEVTHPKRHCLLKCINGPVSENISVVKMLTSPQNC